MNKQQQIREQRLHALCFWIHKGMRWSQDPAANKTWNAISELDTTEWVGIVDRALKNAGIVIKK